MNVTHDGKLLIAVGRSRKSTQWQNKELHWSELLDKLSQTPRTRETAAEYAALPKGERDNIKDVGGFVGGYLKNGKRNNASVVNRCLVCLDADYADEGLLDDLDLTFINTYALYSTHSHTPENMRLRLIIPLARTVTPDEYAAISRRIADELTLTRFDPTTFEPARLMYWPSTPEDGEFVFRYNDAPFLDPDAVFFGTTNEESGYLRDTTGNRRFWPVKTPGTGYKHSWQLTREEIDQIWAEALYCVNSGEKIYLDSDLDALAQEEQREAMQTDEREGLVREYLDKLLPEDWETMDLAERRGFLRGDAFTGGNRVGTVKRNTVCALEIWCECLSRESGAIRRSDSNDIFSMLARIVRCASIPSSSKETPSPSKRFCRCLTPCGRKAQGRP